MKHIRVVAPVKSLLTISETNIARAKKQLREMGFVVSFGKYVRECDEFGSSSIHHRVEDLMNAYADPMVDIILCAGGGYNGNQLLPYLDYKFIKHHPKKLVGFSDNTVLTNAIYAQTKQITYLGPNFGNFSMLEGLEYTIEYFIKALYQNCYCLKPSNKISSDNWRSCQNNRKFDANEGYVILQEGAACGKIIGGNLRTFNLLQGTRYMPNLKNTILFLEDDDIVGEYFPLEFERNLISLTQQNNFNGVCGIVVGASQNQVHMNIAKWCKIFDKPNLKNMPIIINANFGHTTPMATLPIGANACLNAIEKPKIFISKI